MDDVSPEEAISALNQMAENAAAGFFPATGGVQPLMRFDDVELLYRRNAGFFGRFRPVIPDEGRRARWSRKDWYLAALEQALLPQSPSTRRRNYFDHRVMDMTVLTYAGCGVDWRRVHAYAYSLDPAIPAYGQAPFWTPQGQPVTMDAFRTRNLFDI